MSDQSIYDESNALEEPDSNTREVAESGRVAKWNSDKAQFNTAKAAGISIMIFVMVYLFVLLGIDIHLGNDRAVHDAWDHLQFFVNIGFAELGRAHV